MNGIATMIRTTVLACAMAAVIAAVIALPRVSVADKVVFNSGAERQGIVSEDPANPGTIIFQDHRGTLRLPRSSVKELTKEEPYKGYLAIAAGYLEAGNTKEAASYYDKAGKAGAPQDEVQNGMAKVRQSEQKQNRQDRVRKLSEIEEFMGKASEQTKSQDFEGADKSYQKALELNPTNEQKTSITACLIEMNLAWGRQRVDRVDYGGAAKHFAKVRELDPGNEVALRSLIESWKKDPERKKDVADYYEKETARNPNDVRMRLEAGEAHYQLGDFARALPHYLAVFEAKKAEVYGVTPRLEKCFQVLQQEAADKGDFARALEINKQYRDCFPKSDASTPLNYEYALRRQQIDASSKSTTDTARLDQLANLALWCHERGLDDKAKKELAYVLQILPNHRVARQTMTQYARASLNLAQARFDGQDYAAAGQIAQQTIRDYGDYKEVVDLAADLLEKCRTEIMRLETKKRMDAERLADLGDESYQQAERYVRNYRDYQIRQDVGSANDYLDAVKFIDRAIDFWQQARRIDPRLGSPTGRNLVAKIQDAEHLKQSLKTRPVRYPDLLRPKSSRSSLSTPTPPAVTPTPPVSPPAPTPTPSS